MPSFKKFLLSEAPAMPPPAMNGPGMPPMGGLTGGAGGPPGGMPPMPMGKGPTLPPGGPMGGGPPGAAGGMPGQSPVNQPSRKINTTKDVWSFLEKLFKQERSDDNDVISSKSS